MAKEGKLARLKEVVAKTAPALAGALGGPLAGHAVGAISRAVLGEEDREPEEILEALQLDPDALMKLKTAELAFEEARMVEETKRYQIAATDRDSARRREMTLKGPLPGILAVTVVLGFFGVLGSMLFGTLPDGADTAFSIMLGSLGTMTASVMNYYFGSSAGSREKTGMLMGKK